MSTATATVENLLTETAEMFSMEHEAREIADRIRALAVKMDNAGLPALVLLPPYIDVLSVSVAFGATGDQVLTAVIADTDLA